VLVRDDPLDAPPPLVAPRAEDWREPSPRVFGMPMSYLSRLGMGKRKTAGSRWLEADSWWLKIAGGIRSSALAFRRSSAEGESISDSVIKLGYLLITIRAFLVDRLEPPPSRYLREAKDALLTTLLMFIFFVHKSIYTYEKNSLV
jgi:hypothetical protein